MATNPQTIVKTGQARNWTQGSHVERSPDGDANPATPTRSDPSIRFGAPKPSASGVVIRRR